MKTNKFKSEGKIPHANNDLYFDLDPKDRRDILLSFLLLLIVLALSYIINFIIVNYELPTHK